MAETPEQRARTEMERLLEVACRLVQGNRQAQIYVARSVAIRTSSLNPGFGEADSLCHVNARAACVVEAKKHGAVLSSVKVQFGKYSDGFSNLLRA